MESILGALLWVWGGEGEPTALQGASFPWPSLGRRGAGIEWRPMDRRRPGLECLKAKQAVWM